MITQDNAMNFLHKEKHESKYFRFLHMGLKFTTLECNEIKKNNLFYLTFILNNIDFACRFTDL